MKPDIYIILYTLRGLSYCYYRIKAKVQKILCDQVSAKIAVGRMFGTRDLVWPRD